MSPLLALLDPEYAKSFPIPPIMYPLFAIVSMLLGVACLGAGAFLLYGRYRRYRQREQCWCFYVGE